MRAILIFMATILCATHISAGEHKSASTFGEAITLSNSISIEYAISHINELQDKDVLITGTVNKVCEQKGCWMMLKGMHSSIRVTFKDYKFFMPSDIAGKSVKAQGTLHEEEMSISAARHFARDAGQSDAEIQRIKEKTKEYRFIATAVKITS